jgi:hypothetical protein
MGQETIAALPLDYAETRLLAGAFRRPRRDRTLRSLFG